MGQNNFQEPDVSGLGTNPGVFKKEKPKGQHIWTPKKIQELTGGKKWILTPETGADLLKELGLMSEQHHLSVQGQKKLAQINHILDLFKYHLADLLKRNQPLRILDLCSGTASLTLVLEWWLKRQEVQAEVVGVDRQKDFVAKSQLKAERLGYGTRFILGSVGENETRKKIHELFLDKKPHVILALHACDTAADDVLTFGIEEKAEVMMVVPCCQKEISSLWREHPVKDHPLYPVMQSPHLRRQMGAEATDAMRMSLVRAYGYEVQVIEFVESTHTPKNSLLMAKRRGRYLDTSFKDYQLLKKHFGVESWTLEKRLPSYEIWKSEGAPLKDVGP